MKNYYVRYYQTYDEKQLFQSFLQAIASCGLYLHTVTPHVITGYDGSKAIEYTTIWEIDDDNDYSGLNGEIDDALKSEKYNNVK